MGRPALAASRPSWLIDPPDGPAPNPPATTRRALLPFGELSWQDFERLCLRVARDANSASEWRLYGDAGEEQGGIDILSRQPATNRYLVWQVKRHRTFNKAKLDAAIALFLEGEWASQAERFILATAVSLRTTTLVKALDAASRQLADKGIVFESLDAERLSECLKLSPEIVDDFFGRAWVEQFCGREAAVRLGDRLDRRDYAALRAELGKVYRHHFSSVDPGVIHSMAPMGARPPLLPLAARFVPPDIFMSPEASVARDPEAVGERRVDEAAIREARPAVADGRDDAPDRMLRQRQPLEAWCKDLDRAIVVGPPGAGKSTLLRFLALDLLAEVPQLPVLRERWPGCLPIWVSFPFWTRLIAANAASGGMSLEDAAAQWLKLQGEPGLIPLVRRALGEGKVLLLVDGIDEWSDEEGAGTALALLHSLVERRACPAVLSSRPYGERAFRTLDASWDRRDLAPLTTEQQTRFATPWFEAAVGADDRRAVIQAEAFVNEVRRSAQLAELAGTPLLLGGLIGLRLSGAVLPRSRFRAYKELTERLLDSQPAARDKAALRTARGDELDRDARDRVLSALAFHIQQQGDPDRGVDAVPKSAATAFCRQFLEETFALPAADAQRRAEQLVGQAERSLGVLVGKSQRDVGFVHRVFQEFLAAKHISTFDLDDQLTVMRAHGTDPVWRDVLLFTINFLPRPSDVDRMVSALEELRTGDVTQDGSVILLLADIAFGGINQRPETTRRLALETFAEVETGSEAALRQELLQRVISGSTSEVTKGLVRARLRQWFPSWHDANLADATRLMEDWSESGVDEVHWRNLSHTRLDVRRQSAKSIAKRHGADPIWRDRLLRAARNPQSSGACAAMVQALAWGWPDDEATLALVDDARASPDLDLLLGGVSAAVQLGRQTPEDRDRLCQWLFDEWNPPEGVGEVLAAGWPGDPELKTCLLQERRSNGRLSEGVSWILVKAFPQDDDVAGALIASDTFSKHGMLFRGVNQALVDGYSGHPQIVAAIEARIDDYRVDPYTLSWAARIAPTPKAKAALLEGFTETAHIKFWLAGALIDLWGLDDPEVRSAMDTALTWSTKALDELGHLLPRLIPDRAACRGRLLDILRLSLTERRVRTDFALEGLAALDVTADPEALALALQLDVFSEKSGIFNSPVRLIQAFSKAPEVVSLALENLRTREGLISVIALFMGDDPAVRTAVIEGAAALPEDLRLRMVDGLMDRAVEDDDALGLLEEGGRESSFHLISRSLVAEARARHARGDVDDAFAQRMITEAEAIGPVMDSRRVGAVGALAVIGRTDLLCQVLGGEEEKRRGPLSFWSMTADATVCAAFGEYWSVLQEAVGAEPLGKRLNLNDGAFFELFEPVLDVSPEIQAYARDALERLAGKGILPPAALRFAVREYPNTPRTLDLCLSAARGGGSWDALASAFTAGELIGRYFADSTYAHDRLAGEFQEFLAYGGRIGSGGALAALCEAWPQSPVLDAVFSRLRQTPPGSQPAISTAVALKLIATKSEAAVAADRLSEAANCLKGHLWDGTAFWTPAFVRRLKEDAPLFDDMLARLDSGPTANEKLSFSTLMTAARGYSGSIAAWCTSELDRAGVDRIPQSGFDVSVGVFRLVPQRLRELGRGNPLATP